MFFRPEEKSEKWKLILFRINILFFLSYSMCAHSFTIECLRWTCNKFFSNQRFYCVKGVKPACLNAHVAVKYSHNRQTRLQKQDPGCKERKFCFKTVIIWNIQSAYKRVCNSVWICSEHQFPPSSLTESFVWTVRSLFVPGEDVWSYAKKLPHLFQQGGVFYNIVKKDMGTFVFTWCRNRVTDSQFFRVK